MGVQFLGFGQVFCRDNTNSCNLLWGVSTVDKQGNYLAVQMTALIINRAITAAQMPALITRGSPWDSPTVNKQGNYLVVEMPALITQGKSQGLSPSLSRYFRGGSRGG